VTQTPDSFADDAHRYRLDERIATGGMGEVWRATDTSLGREVAVKLLKQEYADDPSFRARFETEAQHAGALHHANIATVFDYGTVGDGRPYLVMELVDGQPLSALLRPESPMDPDAVRDLLAQTADGLAAAHAAGIVHRDVKPANLLVTPDRRVKITDFGIARAAEGMGLTQTGEVMGTPQYLSPEQARGQTATAASDVYSLGVVAFECLAGHRPYVADTAVATALMHLREPVPDLPDEVPDDLAAVVRRAMAKLPQDRYADGAALAAALRDPATAATQAAAVPPVDNTQVMAPVVPPEPNLHAGPTAGHQPDEGERIRKRSSAWPVLLVLALVAVAVVVILLLARALGDDGEPTDEPSRTPSPSQKQSSEPPSEEPTTEAPPPSDTPTETPSETPTETPTETPSETPTETPSETPTETPTESPSTAPSKAPTESPSTSRTETTSPSAASS
jgi:eukaryotic-like serine/threonine-protein kinase